MKQPPPATDNKMEVDPTDGMLLLTVLYCVLRAVIKGCNLQHLLWLRVFSVDVTGIT